MVELSTPILFIIALSTVHKVYGIDFIFGGEAKRVCKAYKLICPVKKVCALQSLIWPGPMKFPVCVHERHVAVKSTICRKAPMPGKCDARFTRWYFNVHMGDCSWFTYSGCGGNQNNFRTVEECQKQCLDRAPGNEIEWTRDRARGQMKTINPVKGEDYFDEDGDMKYKIPTFITAPAKMAEVVDLNNDVRASLQVSSNHNNATAARTGANKRRRNHGSKKHRQTHKHKQKNETFYGRKRGSDPEKTLRALTLLELGPNYETNTKTPKYAEFKGREDTISRFGDRPKRISHLWLMDRRFRRQKRRRDRKKGGNNERTHNKSLSTATAMKQGTYYGRVQLFDILEKPEETEVKSNV